MTGWRPGAYWSWPAATRGWLGWRVCAPAPLAVGERRRAGVLVGSVYVRPFDEEARNAADAAREAPGCALEAARALRQWHDAGLRHGDCYPKNILVDVRDRAQLIGCPKARFVRRGPRVDRARLKDLAQFAIGFGALDLWPEPFLFLATYGETPGLPPHDTLVQRIRPIRDRILARKAARRRTQPDREPGGPPQPVPLNASTRSPRPILRPF